MSSTFTTSKSLQKQGSGDNSGTWDAPLNANFDIIEKALCGETGKTLGSSTVALTQAEVQAGLISFAGTLTANVLVTFPDGIRGQWIVANFTSGAFTVSIRYAAGGTPLVMQQGRSQYVFGNGTGIGFANNLLVDDTTKMPKTGGTFTGAVNGTSFYASADLAATNGLYSSYNGSNYRNVRFGDSTWGVIDRSLTGSFIWQDTSANTKAYLQADGTFVASGNVAAYSDARIKTNVRTIDGALNLIENMRGVRYERLANGRTEVGVIAQEMQAVLPEVVEAPGGDVLMAVSYGNIVGVLIEAVKELSARVRELEAK